MRDFSADPSFTGIISSALADNPYFRLALEGSKHRDPSLQRGKVTKCKVCGETQTTLLKDGEGGYICRVCKDLEVLNEE